MFLLFLHATLLLLSGLSVGSWLIAQMLHTTPWLLPKTMELKLYAVIITAGAIGAWIGRRFFGESLRQSNPLYTLFWSCALPIILLLNAFEGIGMYRLGGIFGLCAIGIGAAILGRQKKYNHLEKITAKIFPIAMSFSLFLLVVLATQNTLTVASLTCIIAFSGIFFFVKSRAKILPRSADIPLFFTLLLFLFFAMFGMKVNFYHYSYYLGPVVEMFYGHKHPLVDVNAQYGGGLTWFLSQYFMLSGHVSNNGMNLLLKFFTVLQYGMLYIIATSLLRSRMLAFCTLLTVLIFCCFSQGADLFSYPSTGPLRFGHIFLILFLYSIPLGKHTERIRLHGSALIAAIAAVWSFESLIYTVPAWMTAEIWMGRGKKAALSFTCSLFVLLCIYLAPPLLAGKSISLARYAEYSLLYASGFGQIPLHRTTDLWWLFPTVYMLIFFEVVFGRMKDIRVVMLSIYGLAIFTYFVGRAHPNNLYHIAIPCILLGVYWLQEKKAAWKNLSISGFLTIFLATNFALFGKGAVAAQIFTNNPITMDSFHTLLADTKAVPEEGNDCAEEEKILRPYIVKNSLALLDPREELYMLYDCLHVSNALNADPWSETAINPKAIARMLQAAIRMPQRILLVNATLLDNASTKSLLAVTGAEETGRFGLQDQTIVLYSLKNK